MGLANVQVCRADNNESVISPPIDFAFLFCEKNNAAGLAIFGFILGVLRGHSEQRHELNRRTSVIWFLPKIIQVKGIVRRRIKDSAQGCFMNAISPAGFLQGK